MTPACYGCPFLNVASEYPDHDYPGHRVALEHKRGVRERFRQLAEEAGAVEPEQLAGALMLLMDGAYMAARVFGPAPDSPAAHVAGVAAQAVAHQCDDRLTWCAPRFDAAARTWLHGGRPPLAAAAIRP